jgi:hypothetical protein
MLPDRTAARSTREAPFDAGCTMPHSQHNQHICASTPAHCMQERSKRGHEGMKIHKQGIYHKLVQKRLLSTLSIPFDEKSACQEQQQRWPQHPPHLQHTYTAQSPNAVLPKHAQLGSRPVRSTCQSQHCHQTVFPTPHMLQHRASNCCWCDSCVLLTKWAKKGASDRSKSLH